MAVDIHYKVPVGYVRSTSTVVKEFGHYTLEIHIQIKSKRLEPRRWGRRIAYHHRRDFAEKRKVSARDILIVVEIPDVYVAA